MRNPVRAANTLVLATLTFAAACGGGGGGGSSDSSGSGVGRELLVVADVASNTCNERLSQVRQVFTLDGLALDTSLFQVTASRSGGSLQAAYSDQNGDCVRDYSLTLGDVNSPNGTALLSVRSTCGAAACETTWNGTFVETEGEQSKTSEEKVRGEACNPNVPSTLGYRPSAFECNGNSAVLMAGSLRNNFSVVVRRNGQFNDRDPENPTCGTNLCSPYKTQKKIELPPYQVNCLGGSGFSDKFAGVNRISIKFTAAVSNANDTSQFEQYCLTNTQARLN